MAESRAHVAPEPASPAVTRLAVPQAAAARFSAVTRYHFASIPSTNAWAQQHLSNLPWGELAVVTADLQTAGRGRFSRPWTAPAATSVLATFAAATRRPKFYLATAVLSVAAVRALDALGVPGAGIKWPNDVMLGDGKCGGVLCEATAWTGPAGDDGPGYARLLLLGIGMNVNTAAAELAAIDRPRWPATSLLAAAGSAHDVDRVCSALMEHVAGVRACIRARSTAAA